MIPDYLKTHKEYTKNYFEINEYFETLSDKELDALEIAVKYLKSSFSIIKSNGFKKWKQENTNS